MLFCLQMNIFSCAELRQMSTDKAVIQPLTMEKIGLQYTHPTLTLSG